ncbi:DUF262 domain-containing protein [Desulfobacterales bacterium HSG2]|nr:DUF262 domain-containing protein [Desulfobacterales bacterium HSG2]
MDNGRDFEDISDSGENSHPFDPTKIRIESKVATIESLVRRMKYDEIDMSPDFQRRDDVWDDRARSRLIESLLVRIPIPPFYLDASDEDRWIIIDGLQRLTTLKEFVINNSLILENLEYLTEFNGKKYRDIPRKFQRRIDETQVTTVLVEKGTPKNVMYNIFKRINTGGQPLSAQEIRHALQHGPGTKLIREIPENPKFREILQMDNKRMEASEMVLRALSYFLFPIEKVIGFDNYDSLLRATLRVLNQKSDRELKKIQKDYFRSLNAASIIFNKYIFRKQYVKNDRKKPLNKPLYETWMFNLSSLTKQELQTLTDLKEEVTDYFIDLMNQKQFDTSVSSGKPHAIKYRIEAIQKLIEEVLNDYQDES